MEKEIFRILFMLFFALGIGLILARIFFHTGPKESISEAYAIFSKDWEEKRRIKKQEIIERFKQQMFDLCDKESIFVEFFEDICQLNEVKCLSVSETGQRTYVDLKKGEVVPADKIASGRYVYLKPRWDTPEQRVKSSLPKIQLQKYDDYVWTLAHELGHHFTIQYQGISTEEAADAYIKTLAEQFLTKEEQEIFHIDIMVYSGEYKKEKITV